jgi:hypothetical protein
MVTTSTTSESDWHPDTGVTHHLTNNMTNLILRSDEYIGSDQVLVGNGAGLHISKVGSSIFHHSKTPFVLNQLLLVPNIQKNLISVKKNCIDNLVYFEFHDSFFLIKDYSRKILHRGTFEDGLYSFSNLQDILPPLAFIVVHASYPLWHYHLGHASFPVLQKSISAFAFHIANNPLPVCSDC